MRAETEDGHDPLPVLTFALPTELQTTRKTTIAPSTVEGTPTTTLQISNDIKDKGDILNNAASADSSKQIHQKILLMAYGR